MVSAEPGPLRDIVRQVRQRDGLFLLNVLLAISA